MCLADPRVPKDHLGVEFVCLSPSPKGFPIWLQAVNERTAESASSPLTTLSNDAIVLTVKRENSTELCLASPAACGGENLKTLVPSDNPPSTEDLKEFVEKFKKERLRLGITQNDVGLILAEKFDKFLSQTTISRFESLTLSYKNMCSLKPLLACLMDTPLEAPTIKKKGPTCPKRRLRTVLHPDIKSVLEGHFKRNSKPSVDEIATIASELNLPAHVLRNWFQNRRQRERRVQSDLA